MGQNRSPSSSSSSSSSSTSTTSIPSNDDIENTIASICGLCNKILSSSSKQLSCKECSKKVHKLCLDICANEFRRLSKTGWFCSQCSDNIMDAGEEAYSDKQTKLTADEKLVKISIIDEKLDMVLSFINTIQNDIKALEDKANTFVKEILDIKTVLCSNVENQLLETTEGNPSSVRETTTNNNNIDNIEFKRKSKRKSRNNNKKSKTQPSVRKSLPSHLITTLNKTKLYTNTLGNISSSASLDPRNQSDGGSLTIGYNEIVPATDNPTPTNNIARNNYNSQNTLISGTSTTQANLRAAEEMRHIFITKCNPQTTTDDIKDYVSSKLICSQLSVQSLKPANRTADSLAFISFKLTVPLTSYETVLKSDFWPVGIYVREFVYRTKNLTQ